MWGRRLGRLATTAGLWLGVALLHQPVHAHGPAPAPLAALSLDGPQVMSLRTSIGLARRFESGRYEYVCPSRWDGNELARAVATLDGSLTLVHSGERAWISADLGCNFAPLDSGAAVAHASRWGDDLLVALDVGSGAHTLGLIEQDQISQRWETPFTIDGMLADADSVWITGVEPAPFVARFDAAAQLQLLSQLDMAASRVSPRAAGDDGVWLLVDMGGTRQLWWADSRGSTELSPDFDVALGPAWFGQSWIAVFDGVLHTLRRDFDALTAEEGGWLPIGDVDWTCLHTLEQRVFACTLDGLFEVQDVQGANVELAWRFGWNQLAAPSDCDQQQLECEVDWVHFAGESGWLGTEASDAPDEARVPQLDGGARVDTGAPGAGDPSPPFDASAKPTARFDSTTDASHSSDLEEAAKPKRTNACSLGTGARTPGFPLDWVWVLLFLLRRAGSSPAHRRR